MSIRSVVTRGYGSFGSIAEIVVRGYTIGQRLGGDTADAVIDYDGLRRVVRAAKRAQNKSVKASRTAHEGLKDAFNRAWERLAEEQPTAAEAVRVEVPALVEAIEPEPEVIVEAAVASPLAAVLVPAARIRWDRVSDVLGTATAILDVLERQRLEAERLRLARIQEEDDLTILVLAST